MHTCILWICVYGAYLSWQTASVNGVGERRGTGYTPVIFSINFLTSVHKDPYSSALRSPLLLTCFRSQIQPQAWCLACTVDVFVLFIFSIFWKRESPSVYSNYACRPQTELYIIVQFHVWFPITKHSVVIVPPAFSPWSKWLVGRISYVKQFNLMPFSPRLSVERQWRQLGTDSHGEVGDESRGGQVHLEGRFLGDGELVPYRALDCGNGIAGHHWTPHMVVSYLQLETIEGINHLKHLILMKDAIHMDFWPWTEIAGRQIGLCQ